MILKKIINCLSAGVLIMALACGFSKAEEKLKKDQDVVLQSFEEAGLPSWISCDSKSHLKLSQQVFQHGKNSLLWRSPENAYLQLNNKTPGLGIPQKVKELRVWVYSEKAGGKLQILAGEAEQFDDPKGCYQVVDYHLNFTGWRSLWIKFDRVGSIIKNGKSISLKNKAERIIRAIRIKALNKKSKNLFFDNLEVSHQSILHGYLGNLQMPKIVTNLNNRHDLPWVAMAFERDAKEFQNFTYNERALEQIQQRIEAMLANGIGHKGKAGRGYNEVIKRVRTDDKGRTHGPAIYSHIVERYYRLKGFPGIHSQNFNGALAYCADKFIKTGDDSWRQKYISYLDFRSEKGYQYGSATMNRVFEAKNAYNYLDSLLKMKAHLDDGRLRREAAEIKWMCGYNYLYSKQKEPVDADKILGDMHTLLVAIYLQPHNTEEEKKRKLYDFMKFKEIIDLTMIPGVDTAKRLHIVKPDYSIWHHDMEMTYSYGYAAAGKYMKYYYLLHGTPAALEPRPAKGILAYYADLFTKGGAGSYMASRGISTGNIGAYAKMLAYGAASGLEQAKSILKANIENKTIKLNSLPSSLQNHLQTEVLDKLSISSYPVASGTHVRPFAAKLVHHGEAYTAVIRGFNESVYSSEIFMRKENAANIYGQQQNNGFLQLYSPKGPQKSGLLLNGGGWDWSLYPGATTVKMNTEQIKKYLPHGRIKFKERTLSGGLAHFNRNGVYFQELTGHKKHSLKDLKGNKSWFFFDDFIVCLGSNIALPGGRHPLVTTLFQYHHGKKDKSLHFESLAAGEHKTYDGNLEEKLLVNQGASISDPAGNSYYLSSNAGICIKRGLQKSRVPRFNNKVTEGYVSTSWIDHGIGASAAGYEYAILPQQPLQAYKTFKARDLYKVLQKDDEAHVVRNNKSQAIAYVILQGGVRLKNSPVLMSEKPLLLMLTPKGKRMQLSLSDPDLKVLGKHNFDPNRTKSHSLQVKGAWRGVKCLNKPDTPIQISVHNNVTELSLDCMNGESYDLELSR